MSKQRGNSLVSIMAVAVILVILVVVVMTGGFGTKKSPRKDGLGTTVVGSVRARALDTACTSNLNQIRLSIQANSSTDDTPPARIEDLHLPESILKCPIGHEPYAYDGAGKVSCIHPGHEKL